ncbi:MAG: ATP phosphoribosyltransferase [Phototrophicaceae bacterium]|jgi:ATP phosphoribosyltransferase
MTAENSFVIALPSKGALAEPTLDFFAQCGMKVWKPNPRQYTGKIPALPNLTVIFQRVKDVTYKVADGTAHLGITGVDVVHEYGDDRLLTVHDNLEYGHCKLLVAVPEAWVDVETVADLTDIALDIRENQNRNLRVATTYSYSARKFLHEQGIHHFTIVKAEGAIEAAPTLGYADVIVDLTQTGTTLRENRLKPLSDGTIINSQAILVGNRDALQAQPELRETVRLMLEYIDASLNGKRYAQLTANIEGTSPEDIANQLTANPITRGLHGPTIAPIYGVQPKNGRSPYTVTLIVNNKHLLEAVEYLRTIGGTQTTVHPVNFVFMEQSPAYVRLKGQLEQA